MRIAWFTRRATTSAHPIDDTRSLLAELGTRHAVELYDGSRAHDFVWQHSRQPFDTCVYDLDDTIESAFVWPYLLHYPGVVRLRSSRLRASRRRWLHLNRRSADDAEEATFAGSDALRIPLVAARLVVVGDPRAAQALQEVYPWAHVRYAPLAVPAAGAPGLRTAVARSLASIGVAATPSMQLVSRAVQRARDAGTVLDAPVAMVEDLSAVGTYDTIVALEWPPRPEPPAAALFAMAAGRPAIVYEVPVTAGWPALDPQTWRSRGADYHEPIVISLDPRDDEHSLMLAMRRLADDAGLRARMGEAARAWSQSRGDAVAQAADAWDRILADAATAEPPPRPAGWPAHLTADGTARARELLGEMGVNVDFLGS